MIANGWVGGSLFSSSPAWGLADGLMKPVLAGGVGLGVQSVTTVSSRRDPAYGRGPVARPRPSASAAPWGTEPVPWREATEGQVLGWGSVFYSVCTGTVTHVLCHGLSGGCRTRTFDLGPGGLPRPQGNRGRRGDPAQAWRKVSGTGEQDAVHARATGSCIPPAYVTRATRVLRKHVMLCKPASTPASHRPWILVRLDGPPRDGRLGWAAGRAAARRPLEAPDGKVPRRLPDGLPGSGGF